MKRRVLGNLIGALQAGDWDTEDESLAEFKDDPAIVAAFVAHGVGDHMEGSGPDGVLHFDEKSERWQLFCEGRKGCGQVGDDEGTAAGHDRMVRLWARHDAEQHEGDGAVPEWMLIESEDGNG
jgi:hypothetical protein